jgi:hypothetical protein
MKTLSILLFSAFLHASIVIDECKTDIYFGNGVWNNRTIATKSLKKLQDFMQNNLQAHSLGFKLAFNHTYGKRRDLIETFYQLKELGQISTGYFHFLSRISTPEYAVLFTDFYLDAMISEEAKDLDTIVKNYEDSIKSGHRVLLVSHSQGNLYGLRAFESLPPWMQPYFRQVSVATPANQVAHNGDWVTDSGDLVIKGLLDALMLQNSLPANTTNKASNSTFSGHEFVPIYLQGDDTSKKMAAAIQSNLQTLSDMTSQWEPVASDTFCLAGQVKEYRHRFDLAIDELEHVYVEGPGKICHKQGLYVFGECDGTEEGNETIRPKNGFVTVGLNWSLPGIDMDLNFEAGEKDIDDVDGLPLEHYVIETESQVSDGLYGISIDHGSSDDEALACLDESPLSLILNVKTPDGHELVIMDVAENESLDIGHVADLYIGKAQNDEKTVRDTLFSLSDGNNKVSTGHVSIGKVEGNFSIAGAPRIYELIPRLDQAMFGPLAGADVLLQPLDNRDDNATIYRGTTSRGSSNLTAGLLTLPRAVKNSLEDDRLYLVTVKGGEDIDADDDLKPDDNATTNRGSSHAILNGRTIKFGGFKVNILTEVAYQVTRGILDENRSVEEIEAHLDEVSGRLLTKDVTGNATIDRHDITAWTPYFDKPKLRLAYDQAFEPIVRKIYRDAPIYEEAYRAVYGTLQVTSVTYDDGYFAIVFDEQTDSRLYDELNITVAGENDQLFVGSIEREGNVVRFSPEEALLSDGAAYRLTVTTRLDDGQGVSLLVTGGQDYVMPDHEAPRFHIPDSLQLLENSTLVTLLKAVDTGSEVTYRISGGSDAASFKILYGDQLLFKQACDFENPFDHDEDNRYQVDITATDASGNAAVLALMIDVLNVEEPLSVGSLTIELDETKSEQGSVIGQVPIYSAGEGIERFVLDNPIFFIDTNGSITLNEPLSYERMQHLYLRGYRASYTAYDRAGQISQAYLRVNLADKQELLPELASYTGSVDEHLGEGSTVGQMFVYAGVDGEVEVSLEGEAAEDFTVGSDGLIRVADGANIDYATIPVYRLRATARNVHGESDDVNLTIHVKAWTKQYGGEDYVEAIASDNQRVCIAGTTYGRYQGDTSVGGSDGFVSCFDAEGNVLFHRQFGTAGSDYMTSITMGSDHSVIITGETYGSLESDNRGKSDVYVTKFAADGKQLWAKSYGGSDYDSVNAVQADSSGNLYVGGSTRGSFEGASYSGGNDAFVMKLSAAGEIIWCRQFGSSGHETLDAMALTDDAIVVTGSMNAPQTSDAYDLFVRKIGSEGNTLWQWLGGTDNYEEAVAIESDGQGQLYLAANANEAMTYDHYTSDTDMMIVMLDGTGQQRLEHFYGSPAQDEVVGMVVRDDGTVYLSGRTEGHLYGNRNQSTEADTFVMQIAPDGAMVTTRQFGSFGWDYAYGMAGTGDAVYVTGFTDGVIDHGARDRYAPIFLMKVPVP